MIKSKLKKRVFVDLTNVNWKLLRDQKLCLLKLLDHYTLDHYVLDGLINFLDDIQDQAAERLGEKAVFGNLKRS